MKYIEIDAEFEFGLDKFIDILNIKCELTQIMLKMEQCIEDAGKMGSEE